MDYTRAAGFLIYRVDYAGKWQFFLERRAKTIVAGGQYGTPGGYVESTETPLQAAFREINEELGITRDDISLRYAYATTDVVPEYSTFIAEWSGKRDLSRNTLKLNKAEVEDVDWFYPEQLPNPLLSRFAAAIPSLQIIIGEIALLLKTKTNPADMALLNGDVFYNFFQQWHIQTPTPEPTRNGYLKMAKEFINWKDANKPNQPVPAQPTSTAQPNNSSNTGPATNVSPTSGGTSGTGPKNSPTPTSQQEPTSNPAPNTSNQGTGTSGPTLQSIRDDLGQIQAQFDKIVSRLQGPPWVKELADIGTVRDDLRALRRRTRRVDWDTEMGGPSKKQKTA